MTIAQPEASRKPLRLWPGIIAAVLLLLVRFGLPRVAPSEIPMAVLGGMGGAAIILLWWLFFSRAPWLERLGALALMIAALFATSRLLDVSIAKGLMGFMFPIYAVPVLAVAFVAWAVATHRLSDGLRRASMVAVIFLASAVWILLRTDGITGSLNAQLAWRWTPTSEERLLARVPDEPAPPPTVPAVTPAALPATPVAIRTTPAVTEPPAVWPGFRGPHRDAVVPGIQIDTDWAASPPRELWRRPVGPGWSSFAVRGRLVYTQEQRGDNEVVACYDIAAGKPVWTHRDAARFWESNGGAGPRGTPTLSGDRVYAFGATGILNVLDAATGAVVWSKNVAADTATKTPTWGFASSPLIVDDVVIVAAGGKLAALELASGTRRWVGESRGGAYSSPHLVTIDGVPQVLLMTTAGTVSVAPADGKVLWEHKWPAGTPIVQPALASDADVLISAADRDGATGAGIRRIAVSRGASGWTTEERWASLALKPYFNDFVVHKGHAFGFDGNILACVDLSDGKRKWKGGRYGSGQLVLLADQDLLLVLSEEGELALVSAATDQFREVGRAPGIEGKTWNHPVLAGDTLLVRNGQEMAAFKLARR